MESLVAHFLNVGHGDCTFIELPSRRLMMIDINNSKSLPETDKEALAARKGISTLEFAGAGLRLGGRSWQQHYESLLVDPYVYYQDHFSGEPVFRYLQTHPDMDHMSGLHRFFWLEKVPLVNFWDVPHSKELDEDSFGHGPYNYQDWLTYLQLRKGRGPKGGDGTLASHHVIKNTRLDRGQFWTDDGLGRGPRWRPAGHPAAAEGVRAAMAVPSVAIGPGRALDAYSIRARWAPVFLVVLPPLTLCFSLVPGLPTWNKLWPLLGAAGIVILVDQLGRDGGKRLQPGLWDSWGGAPTTGALRHRDAANPVLLARQHERIAAIVGHALPTADEERADPAGADHVYQAAIAVLIARTRGRRREYPLIFAENCNYGFRRNMLGLRPWGRLLAAAAGLLALAAIAARLAGLENIPLALASVVLVVSAAATVIWWRVVTPDWVQPVAWAYAERLLEAAETLAETS